MTVRRPGTGPRFAVALIALGAAISTLVVPAIATATAGAATLPRPKGAGPPVAASGMGTRPRSTTRGVVTTTPGTGPYGRFDTTEVGGGPVCVKAWKAGADNGGATSQGVTKDKITVVAVLPNDEQLKTDPVEPKHMADNVAQHLPERALRLPAAADAVLRDVGPRHRGQVRHVVGQRRGRAARRPRRDQGDEAVRGVPRRSWRASTCSRPSSRRRRSRSWASRPPRRRRTCRRRTAGVRATRRRRRSTPPR